MESTKKGIAILVISAAAFLATSGSAFAQAPGASVSQLLDSVTVLGQHFAIGLNDDEPPGFDELLNDPVLDFIDCDANTAQGIACLDRDLRGSIRIWDSLSNPTTPSVFFECLDNELPVNSRKGNPCTAIAMDTQGNIFIGARLNGTANVVLKIIEDPEPDPLTNGSDCPADFTSFTNDNGDYLCYAQLASGRPVITDIDVIESSVKRLLVLEEKKTALIYKNFEDNPETGNQETPLTTEVDEIASGKRDFDLAGNEQVINAAFMEYLRPEGYPRAGESDFFVLATTDRGRLAAVDAATGSAPSAYTKFDLVANRIATDPADCPAGDNSFDVATSSESGVSYATDFNDCSLHVLSPQSNAAGDFSGFALVGSSLPTSVTEGAQTTFFQPLDVSVSPGIGFDLDDCFPNCEIIASAASLLDVQVASGASNVILYQVADIPHCAWIPDVCVEILDLGVGDPVQLLIDEDVLRTLPCSGGSCENLNPQALEFNVTPLLPDEVTNNYQLQTDLDDGAAPNGKRILDSLWLTTDYRAQRFAYDHNDDRVAKNFRFNALFFVPEPGVITDGVLELQLNVRELLRIDASTPGPERGCTLAQNLPADFGLADLLDWDVTVRVSELFKNVGTEMDEFIGTPANVGCINPSRSRGGGVSMFPFDFEVTPCPVTLHTNGQWLSDTEGGVACETDPALYLDDDTPDDTVFAKLYDKLYDELLAHLQGFACTNVDILLAPAFEVPDPLALEPLSPQDCATLEANWQNGKLKFDKALGATFDPKLSSGSENFGSVQAQLTNYIAKADAASPYGDDPANRVGENIARAQTLLHILVDKLIPSIEAAPNNQFVEADLRWATD